MSLTDKLLTGQAQHLIGALIARDFLTKSITNEQYIVLWDVVKRQLKAVNQEGARAIESAAIAPLLERIAELEEHALLDRALIDRLHTSMTDAEWRGVQKATQEHSQRIAELEKDVAHKDAFAEQLSRKAMAEIAALERQLEQFTKEQANDNGKA